MSTPTPASATPAWSTACYGADALTSPMELGVLASHLQARARSGERWFAVRCAAGSMHSFVAPRMVTTVVLATLLISLGVAML